jgi:PAS domain S-box-containing protein
VSAEQIPRKEPSSGDVLPLGAEPSVLVSLAHVAAIVESSDDAILSKDLNGVIQSCNPATQRTFGYTAAELIGRSVRMLIPEERQAEEDDILRRIRDGERVNHFETIRITKDQRRLDVSLTISPVRDASGVVIAASSSVRDITEQKRARAAQAYLAAIVESSEDAILSKDLNGIVRSCNQTAERLFGYSASELIGRSIRVLIPPDRQAEEDHILATISRGERIEHFETVRMTKDGRILEISLSVSPVRDSSGAIVGVSKSVRDITEQKRLARELAAQHEWFRVTLGSIGDGVVGTDTDGRVTYVNAEAAALTGWTTEEAANRPLADIFRIINEKTGQPAENPVGRVLRSGQIAGLANHTVLIHRDGTPRPIADSAAPIRDASGRTIGVVLVFRDVTAERRAEEAIAEQREWFETTLKSIGDAVIATDVEGRVAFMNPIAEHLTGSRLDDARGRACTDVFHIVNEETRRAVDSPVARALAEGVIVGLANHTLLIAADGTEHPIDDSAAPIRRRDGRIMGVVLVFRDVHERRQAEQALRDSEDRFRALADNIAQLAWIADEGGAVVWCNRRWLDYSGEPFEELQGWGWQKVLHPVQAQAVVEKIRRTLETGEGWEDTFLLRGSNGAYRWFLSRAAPIRDEHGRLMRWFGTNTDITDQRRAEEALLAADRSKDEFLAALAHELRSPIAPIVTAIELLKLKGPPTPELQKLRDVISRQTRQLSRLVDDLLDVGRIVSGKLQLEPALADLNAIVQQAVEMCTPAVEQRKHALVVTLSDRPIYVDADVGRIVEVVGNILGNAAKYTPDGGRIELAVSVEEGKAIIRVRDNGLGISPDMLERVFQRFVQVDTAAHRACGGLGIGLAIVKAVVELHGGSVEARSEGIDQGSEFIVRLPVAEFAT